MTDTRRSALAQWQQREDDVLLYTPDGSTEATLSSEGFRELQRALRMGVLSARDFIEACLRLPIALNPVSGTPLTLEE